MPYESSVSHLYDYSKIMRVYLYEYMGKMSNNSDSFNMPFDKHGESDVSFEDIKKNLSPVDFSLSDTAADIIYHLYDEISANISESLPLEHICESFRLSMFERFTIALSIMPYIDSEFEKYFVYINDNIYMKLPTLNLALKLFGENDLSSVLSGNMFKFILEPAENPLAGELKLNARIIDYLLKGELCKSCPYINTIYRNPDETIFIHQDQINTISKLMDSGNKFCVVINGETGSGRRFAVSAVTWITVIDIDKMRLDESGNENSIPREVILRGGYPFLRIKEGTDENILLLNRLIERMEEISDIIFVSTCDEADVDIKVCSNYDTYYIKIPELTREQRFTLWESSGIFNGDSNDSAKNIYHSVANKYKFTPEKIIKASGYVKNIAQTEKTPITEALLDSCCNIFSQNAMGSRAQITQSQFTFDDLVLPEKDKKQIIEGINHIKYRHIVYDKWGLEQKLAYGKGLVMLFSGPSGTGKTMAATIVAGELGLTAYRVDISKVMSKYIGETEKNLSEIFDIARRNNIILFFDECDALFSKRSEVNDSHDRYANVETSFLLQQLENFDGVVLMSTNFLQNIDEAFLRRINYIVKFPLPDCNQRLSLWQKMFTAEMPLGDDIDCEYLSRQFELSGAMIKNSVTAAAFLAAESGGDINMAHILRAISGQLHKQGKVLLKEDFGKYYGLI